MVPLQRDFRRDGVEGSGIKSFVDLIDPNAARIERLAPLASGRWKSILPSREAATNEFERAMPKIQHLTVLVVRCEHRFMCFIGTSFGFGFPYSDYFTKGQACQLSPRQFQPGYAYLPFAA
jgi:hypothetical protein